MKTAIVIPVRYSSSRFPGKPLAEINGKTLLARVWELASAVKNVEHVLVATDDSRIEEECHRLGATSILTSSKCRNGSERCYDAVKRAGLKVEVVVSFQGDAPLIPPFCVENLLESLAQNRAAEVATPALRLSEHQLALLQHNKQAGLVSGTTVVFSRSGRALYFSKSILPFVRSTDSKQPVYKHLGVYAYRFSTLERYVALDPGSLEECEGLEQLRLLENDIPIDVVEVDLGGRELWSVDNPADIAEVERILNSKGEIL